MNTKSKPTPAEELKAKTVELADIFTRTRNREELFLLLEGLLTPAEIEGIFLRWQLLKLLADGMTQREIMKQLGICLGKISRGSRLLKYGDPRFGELLERIRNERKESQRKPKK